MMQRLLTVSSTYLKFTFACMLGATAVFSLAGLAIASPKIFLPVVAVTLAAFFIVRVEVKSWRHIREISDRTSAVSHPIEESFAPKKTHEDQKSAEAQQIRRSAVPSPDDRSSI
jgi:hypothetical protein